jgi:hypothetical protein
LQGIEKDSPNKQKMRRYGPCAWPEPLSFPCHD